jgi:hypothetical protein
MVFMCPLNAYSFPLWLIRILSLEFFFPQTNDLADNEIVVLDVFRLTSRSVKVERLPTL